MERTIVATKGHITSVKRGKHWIGIGTGVSYDKTILVVITTQDNETWRSSMMVKTTCPNKIRNAIIDAFYATESSDLEFFCSNFNAAILSMDMDIITKSEELRICGNIAQKIWKWYKSDIL